MGNVDLFHSRRTNHHKCDYWVRDERTASGTPEEWVYKNAKTGSFWAKIIETENNQMNVINGMWALDSNNLTLETTDDVYDLKRGSLVRFDDNLWLVGNVQRKPYNKESEFSKKITYRYFIPITRG